MKRVADFILDEAVEALVSTAAAPVGGVESPPNWVLLRAFRNTGQRQKKLVRTYAHVHHGSYPDSWGPSADTSGLEHILSRRERRAQKRAARREVPGGNLSEGDYQFWQGSPQPSYLVANCRWCGRFFYSREARREHFRKETYCSHMIRAVQNYAAGGSVRYCFVCNVATDKLRWGFPLCARTECIGKWKFGRDTEWDGWLTYKELAKDEGLLKPFEGTR